MARCHASTNVQTNHYSIKKYKGEMQEAKEKKEELKAKAKLPPGTRLMGE